MDHYHHPCIQRVIILKELGPPSLLKSSFLHKNEATYITILLTLNLDFQAECLCKTCSLFPLYTGVVDNVDLGKGTPSLTPTVSLVK